MGAVSTSKKSNAGKNVLVFFIVFMILEMLIIFGIGKIFKNRDVTPSVMGYSLFITREDLVQNGPDGSVVAVPKNVLVIASNGLPTDVKGNVGRALLCEEVDGVGTGVFWLADYESQDGKDGVDYVVTNGTQGHVIKASNIVGVCASYFVTAGKVINFVTQKFGMICCVVVPLFLLVLLELIIAIATHSSSDDDEDEEDDEEEQGEKNVELDDFLFGGQNEGEQIAKRRKKKKPMFEDDEEEEEDEDDEPVKPAKKAVQSTDFDFDDFKPKKPAAVKPEPAEPEIPVQQPVQEPEAPAQTGSLRLQEDEMMNKYYEKASQIVDGGSAETENAPSERPARRPAGQRPRRRRPAGAARNVSSDSSLEDLMKIMEEEQNKLKNQMK